MKIQIMLFLILGLMTQDPKTIDETFGDDIIDTIDDEDYAESVASIKSDLIGDINDELDKGVNGDVVEDLQELDGL